MAAEQQKLAGSWALKQLNRLLLQTSFKKNPTVKLQTAILPKLTRRHSERRRCARTRCHSAFDNWTPMRRACVGGLLDWRSGSVVRCARMGDRRRAGIPSRYVTGQLGQPRRPIPRGR